MDEKGLYLIALVRASSAGLFVDWDTVCCCPLKSPHKKCTRNIDKSKSSFKRATKTQV